MANFQPTPPKRVANSSLPVTLLPTRARGSYLWDADAVWLVVERGSVVIHISNLDVHLARDHLARERWDLALPHAPASPLPSPG